MIILTIIFKPWKNPNYIFFTTKGNVTTAVVEVWEPLLFRFRRQRKRIWSRQPCASEVETRRCFQEDYDIRFGWELFRFWCPRVTQVTTYRGGDLWWQAERIIPDKDCCNLLSNAYSKNTVDRKLQPWFHGCPSRNSANMAATIVLLFLSYGS